jgi:carboxyl-terminal processing protease
MTALPLNEKSRIALRDTQKEKALSIENKRRQAKGEELLTSLQDDEDKDEDSHSDDPDLEPLAANETETDDDDVDQEDEEKEEEEEDVTDDVLLMEAGYVLVDALLLKQRRYALHHKEETVH